MGRVVFRKETDDAKNRADFGEDRRRMALSGHLRSDDLDQLKSEIERCIPLSAINMQAAAAAFPPRVENVVEADSATARFIVVVGNDFRIPRVTRKPVSTPMCDLMSYSTAHGTETNICHLPAQEASYAE